MEGSLYYSGSGYYLINSVASFNVIVVEFETFSSKFISKENLQQYDEIKFNAENVKSILDNYSEFRNNIGYDLLDDYNELVFNKKFYIVKNWTGLFNFVACRF
jgi:hypothetical protein